MNTKNCLKVAAVCCLAVVLLTSYVHAASAKKLTVTVPNDFYVGDTSLKAGKYNVEQQSANPPLLNFRDESGKSCALIATITRISQDPSGNKDSRLVFDRVDDCNHLSEIWFAGSDGFLVRGTDDNHVHNIVTTSE